MTIVNDTSAIIEWEGTGPQADGGLTVNQFDCILDGDGPNECKLERVSFVVCVPLLVYWLAIQFSIIMQKLV